MSSPAVQLRSRIPHRLGRGLADAAVERARLTVVPRRRTRAPRVPFVSLVSLVLLGGVVGLLLFNTSMQQASFAATALEQQASTLSAREQTLRMELDVLRDPQHVAERAQALGMVPATSPAFLRLSDGKVVGVPAAASATEGLRIRPRPPVKPAILSPRPVVRTVVVDPRAPEGAGGDRQGSTGDRRPHHDDSARR